MKRVTLLVSLILCAVIGKSQFTNTQTISNASTLYKAVGGLTAGIGGVITNYTDTVAANATVIDGISGAEIFTTSDNIHWIRNANATAWIRQATYANLPTGTVTSVSGLTPLFTVSNPTTTPTFVLSNTTAYSLFGRSAGTGSPSYIGALDSNFFATGYHTENYFNTKYLPIGTAFPTYYNSNVGSGYRWAVPNTNNVKSLIASWGVLVDSTSTANTLTLKVDSNAIKLLQGWGGTQTWQQTLDMGSTLNKSNTILGGGNDLTFDNLGIFILKNGTTNSIIAVSDEIALGSVLRFAPYSSNPSVSNTGDAYYNTSSDRYWGNAGGVYKKFLMEGDAPASYWTKTNNYLYPNNTTDSVGIGTATPIAPLHVNGNARFVGGDASDSSFIVRTNINGTNNYMKFGRGFGFFPANDDGQFDVKITGGDFFTAASRLTLNPAGNIILQQNNGGANISTISLFGSRNYLEAPTNYLVGTNGTYIAVSQNTLDPSARLQIESTTQGLLIPRLSTSEQNAIPSPANGLHIYNTDSLTDCIFDGTVWRMVALGEYVDLYSDQTITGGTKRFNGTVNVTASNPSAFETVAFNINPPTPATSTTGNGTDAIGTSLSVGGGRGGNTSWVNAVTAGGKGANAAMVLSGGGNASGANTTNTGGAAGIITIQTGAGGNATNATTNNGGVGGVIKIQTGAGGNGSTLGGVAGDISLKPGVAGTGGNVVGASVFISGGVPSGSGLYGRVLLGLDDQGNIRGNVGVNEALPDSGLTVKFGIYGKRGVRFTGLLPSANAADSMMVVNVSNGNVGYRAIPSAGTVLSGTGYSKFSGTTPSYVATIPVTDGGTGVNTGTTAYSLLATGTTATGAFQTLANGATTTILVGGGASALPVWTTATGSGAPVRATSPALVTPAIGVATGTSLVTSSVLSSGSQVNSSNATTAQTYRTTNAGSDITPTILGGSTTTTAGLLSQSFDVTNGLIFSAMNGTRRIARGGLNITNLTNTAAAESGDLAFYTQSAGGVLSNKFTISSTGYLVNNSVAYSQPTTGATVTTTTYATIIDPAGTLANLTIALPGSPASGQMVTYSFSQIVTTLAFSGGTLANTITTASAGSFLHLIFQSTANKWFVQ